MFDPCKLGSLAECVGPRHADVQANARVILAETQTELELVPAASHGQLHHPYIGSCLEPRPHAHCKSNLTRSTPVLTHKGGGLAETSVEGDADIGGKLASDFIAQPKPQFEVVETRAGRELLDTLDPGSITWKWDFVCAMKSDASSRLTWASL